jgi:hypothetical protein
MLHRRGGEVPSPVSVAAGAARGDAMTNLFVRSFFLVFALFVLLNSGSYTKVIADDGNIFPRRHALQSLLVPSRPFRRHSGRRHDGQSWAIPGSAASREWRHRFFRDYMPVQFITFRWEYDYRGSSVP